MHSRSATRIRTSRRMVAGAGVALALVLTSAGCAEEAVDQEIDEVEDTEAPVDPTVEPAD